MAIQQVITTYINLKGDGAATTFVFALQNLYQFANGIAVPFGGAGVVPTAVSIPNPPFAVTSSTVDANGNITITLTSALGNGVVATFQLDLAITSGASSSTSPTQTTNVTIVGSSATQLLDSAGTNKASISAAGAVKVDGSAVTQPVSGTVSITANSSVNLNQVAGTALGATAVTNFGTAPAAAAVPGVNASIYAGTSGITATANALDINLKTSAATVTVSGTVAATQSGTWTVQPGNTANTTPWLFTINQGGNSASVSASNALKVDGSAVTQPVSGTVAATQSGNWTARIVGNAGATLDTSASQNQAMPTNMLVIGGEFNTTPTTITTGNASPLQMTSAGSLIVDSVELPAAAAAADAFANPTISQIGADNMLFNGTTWDRARSATIGNTVAATGLLAGAQYGEFLTTFPTLTTGTYGAIQLDSSGRQYVTTSDTAVASTALGALNAAISVAMQGQTSVGFQLLAGTLIGTIVPELSYDGGTTWFATQFKDPVRSSYFNNYVFAASNTATFAAIDTAGGCTNARVRVSAFTSGTANAVLNAGKSGHTTVTVSQIDGQKTTYRATITNTTAITQGTASPVMSIVGSSTKIIRVTRIRYGGWSAATGANVAGILRRYSALSGGTSATMTAAKLDTNDPAATAVATSWSAAATTATVVNALCSDSLTINTTAVTNIDVYVDWQFGVSPGSRELVLRGTADFVGVAFTGVGTTPTANASGYIEWTEE